jgi:hypothetical protein
MWFGVAERVSACGNESGRDPMMTWWCAAGQGLLRGAVIYRRNGLIAGGFRPWVSFPLSRPHMMNWAC